VLVQQRTAEAEAEAKELGAHSLLLIVSSVTGQQSAATVGNMDEVSATVATSYAHFVF